MGGELGDHVGVAGIGGADFEVAIRKNARRESQEPLGEPGRKLREEPSIGAHAHLHGSASEKSLEAPEELGSLPQQGFEQGTLGAQALAQPPLDHVRRDVGLLQKAASQ